MQLPFSALFQRYLYRSLFLFLTLWINFEKNIRKQKFASSFHSNGQNPKSCKKIGKNSSNEVFQKLNLNDLVERQILKIVLDLDPILPNCAFNHLTIHTDKI